MIVVFLFAPVSEAQTVPTATDGNVALFKADEKEAGVGSVVPDPLRKIEPVNGRRIPPVYFYKKQFLVISAAVYAASFADMHQTMQERHYSWWVETDPLARPMVKLPAPAYYATGFVLATGLNWLSWKMGHSRRWHKLVPIPQLLAIAGNTYGFKSNRFRNN
jgi:hypothetical protein